MDAITAKLILTNILNVQKILLASEAAKTGLISEEKYKKFLTDVISVLPDSKDLFH